MLGWEKGFSVAYLCGSGIGRKHEPTCMSFGKPYSTKLNAGSRSLLECAPEI